MLVDVDKGLEAGTRRHDTVLIGLALAGIALLAVLTASYLSTDLNYDEAVYLTLARKIVDTGLPLRRSFDDFTQFTLFRDSPPLAIYVAAVTQRFFPGDDTPTRLVHAALFVLPTYLLVWLVSWRTYGPLAGLMSVAALLSSGNYVNDTQYVQMDVPLGLFALIALVCFERACVDSARARRWALLAGFALAAASWTKFQSICIPGAVALFTIYAVRTEGASAIKRLALPFAWQVAAGAAGIGALVVYYMAFGTGSDIADSGASNLRRMLVFGLGPVTTFRAMLDACTRCVRWLGPVFVVAAFLPVLQGRKRDLSIVLAAYVGLTLAFNVIVFNMPGSGSYYLLSAVPAGCVLAGAAASSVAQALTQRHAFAVLGLAAVVQFLSVPPRIYMPPYVNASRAAAGYIAAADQPQAGVLATTRAIEFYAGNPVSVIRHTSKDVLLDRLAGTGPDNVGFVVVPRSGSLVGTESFRGEWEQMLRRHFVEADVKVPGFIVYRRDTGGESR
ncbi:MAG: ArnT family glycosyltransferase [Vicinamibacterales bacterium]